jgi:hypothetical protein
MTGDGARDASTTKAAGTGGAGIAVTVAAWLVAVVLLAGLAFAVSQRLGGAAQALKEAILQSRTSTSVAYEAQAIAPPPDAETGTPDTTVIRDAEGRVITPPRWIAVPSPDYPINEDGDMVPGTVAMSCRVTVTGALSGCQILSETPPGRGFGVAAQNATALARLTPREVDGVPSEGQVSFTMRFTPVSEDRPSD